MYQAVNGVNLKVFFHWSDVLFELLINREFTDVDVAKKAFQELMTIVPTGGEPLYVQAQSGMICLLTAFDILANGGQTTIKDAINATLDAEYNYYCHVRRRIKNDISVPDNFEFLKNEADRQVKDVAFVKNCEQSTRSDLIEYRIDNLQYAIPPAV
jgi:hypothetical protein